MIKNVIWFRGIQAIGGTEQFIYEIAKKYGPTHDIVVMYEHADAKQIERFSKYVRCKQWHKPEIIECEKFFANFNLEICSQGYVKAKEYYFVVHANFNELGYKPNVQSIIHLNPKFIAVSKWARDEFIKYTGLQCEYCYNPLTIEPKEEVVHLVSACRLNDKVKGGQRTLQLIKALDKYAESHNRHYLWHIFTNEIGLTINSKNVALMPRRTDVRPYIQDADYVLQLSNDMETYCYTLNEAWEYGVHTISTPLSVLKELPVPLEANYILDWDCENIYEVVKHIFEEERKSFIYKAPKDNWLNYFAEGESEYQKELKRMYRVKALKKFEGIIDNEVNRPRHESEEFVVSKMRLERLQTIDNLIEVLGEVVEEATPKKEVKKAIKKPAKKK